VYYGAEKPSYAIILLSEFIQINSIATNPTEGYAIYQLYPFTYYFVLPEPVPPRRKLLNNMTKTIVLNIYYLSFPRPPMFCGTDGAHQVCEFSICATDRQNGNYFI